MKQKPLCMLMLLLLSSLVSIPVHAIGYLRYKSSGDDKKLLLNIEKEESLQHKELVVSSGLFEGDIVTNKEQVVSVFGQSTADIVESLGVFNRSAEKAAAEQLLKRQLGVMTTYNLLWNVRDSESKVIIPYGILSTISSTRQQVIVNAMKHIEDKAGVFKFIARTTEIDYLFFQDTDAGCWSYVGRQGGKQLINVVTACSLGNIVHEICHALGFWHEQSRSDRDTYVTILWDNIIEEQKYNFNKQSTNSLGSSYDYSSIMHYPDYAFGLTAFSCSLTEAKTNQVALIHFKKSDLDSNTDYCMSVQNGDTALTDGNTVQLRPCGENNYVNQQWIIEGITNGYNIFRFALDPTYCITVSGTSSTAEGAPVVVKKCVETTYTYQKFGFFQSSWDFVYFRWSDSVSYLITRSSTVSSAQTYSMKISINGADSWYNQIFSITFASKTTGYSKQINTYCSATTLKTIDTKGNAVGQRDGLSSDDTLQLQLLYQCPSGPRSLSSFCTTTCKCKFNQGKCTSSSQCVSGLECRYDNISLNRCLNPTSAPTTKPTTNPSTSNPSKSPSKAPLTVSPTKNPTKNPTQLPTKTPTNTPVTYKPINTPTYAPATGSPTLNPTLLPTTTSPTNNPITKSPTKAPVTSNPTPPTTSKPTFNPTRKPTASLFGDNAALLPGGSVKAFDLYLLIDATKSYETLNIQCINFKLMSGASPISCTDLLLDYAIEIVKSISTSIGYYSNDLSKGLRVQASVIKCIGSSRDPTVEEIFALTSDSTVIMNGLNNARTTVVLTEKATCPIRGVYEVIKRVEDEWLNVDKRPYRALITFTDGLFYDAAGSTGNALINAVSALRYRCSPSLVIVPYLYDGGDVNAQTQQISLKILTGNIDASVFEAKNAPWVVIPRIGEQITSLLSPLSTNTRCTSKSSFSTSDKYWCGYNHPTICSPRASCEWLTTPTKTCSKIISQSGCNFSNKSTCQANQSCQWNTSTSKCTRKPEIPDCNAYFSSALCLTKSNFCTWNTPLSKCQQL